MYHVRIHTLFPDYFESPLRCSIVGRAIARDLVRVDTFNIRDQATDRHRTADDEPFGGGAGMVMKIGPVVASLEVASQQAASQQATLPRWLLGPAGRPFDQALAREWSEGPGIELICGHYEGIDGRIEHFVDGEVSVGDYVLTGGEPAAVIIVDAICRLLPGVLGNADSAGAESHTGEPLLEHPHYTRPREFRGFSVPDVLLSGNHAAIERWRRQQSLLRTQERRPDLWRLAEATLSKADRALIADDSDESRTTAKGT